MKRLLALLVLGSLTTANAQDPAFIWQNTRADGGDVYGENAAILAYAETQTGQTFVTGICRTDGQTTAAELSFAANVGSAANATEIPIDFAIFDQNQYTGIVHRPTDGTPASITLTVPLDSPLLVAFKAMQNTAYRVGRNVQNVSLTGSSNAINGFIADCNRSAQGMRQLAAVYATCNLGPRSRSPIRRRATIVNNSGSTRIIRRLQSNGRLGGPTTVAPGQRIRLDSRVHTIYQFEDESGNCIQRTRVRASEGTIILTAPNRIVF